MQRCIKNRVLLKVFSRRVSSTIILCNNHNKKAITTTHLVTKQPPNYYTVYSDVTDITPPPRPKPLTKISSLPSSQQEEFAGWGSTSLLHKERCCLSLGTRFITASKTRAPRDKKKKKKILRRKPRHRRAQLARRERHKANNSRESWFRRQRRTSRTLILCDCSLLCTSKWHITVSVKKWLPAVKQPRCSLFFFFLLPNPSLNNGAVSCSEFWVPERPSMQVTTVLFRSEVQHSLWMKRYCRAPLPFLWPALTLEKRLR